MTIFLSPFAGIGYTRALKTFPLVHSSNPGSTLADDAFEHLPAFGLFHDYALTELTVYGHGKAGHGLSFAKRKIEPALENRSKSL